ncbi:MAG: cytosine permease [Naasia sp.]|jgi:NCS1 family nucleobase:cation symporter-1|uniref:purine-cytosine permease family protein n=1 Tax=Naasia sp. TaxID=2546198 RepID=UPI00262235DB|nr:cytosine permease [Naasia sp.]MCU1571094.1 cytosine permease [Naasia sp.]
MTTAAPSRPSAAPVIEPGGIEAIPLERRHGSPWQLLATWSAPNLEFATVFVGVIAVAFFGLGFWQAMAALVLGNLAGSITHAVLSSWGPREGLAQMVLGRSAFGYWGNVVPSALNTVMAGVGWFAVNSVSGAFALATLTGMPVLLGLLIVVVVEVAVAFIGHDVVQLFERYAALVLGVIFLVATVILLGQAAGGGTAGGGGFTFAGFTLAAGAAFGYAAGWNPYASDYTRYLSPRASRRKVGAAAGIGNFVSCTLLMAAGAGAATLAGFDPGSPTDSFTAPLPPVVRELTLLAIAVGAIAANALNIYSGAMSFLAAGIRIPFALRRAIVALGFGVVGFLIAWAALPDAAHSYENFLLVIAYWVAPWLGVVLTDRFLRRGTSIAELVAERPRYVNIAGVVALVVAGFLSIWLFSNQAVYVGVLVQAAPDIGDLTALVGFVLAAGIYAVLFAVVKPAKGHALSGDVDAPPVGVDAAERRG